MTLKEYLRTRTTLERKAIWGDNRGLRVQIYAYANGRKPSLERCKWIEEITGGLVTRKELRPDWFE